LNFGFDLNGVTSGKILIIHQGAIGDFILSLPAIIALKEYFPQLSFHFMGYPDTLELLPVKKEQVVSINVPGFSSLYTIHPDPPPEIKQYLKQFERVIIFGTKGEETLVKSLKIIGIKEVFRIDTFPDRGIHVIDHQATILASMGIRVVDKIPRLIIKDEEHKLAKSFLLQCGIEKNIPLIFLHPGAGSEKKSWPPERFAQLARNLYETLSAKLAVIEGPADKTQTEEFYTHLQTVPTEKITSLPLRTIAAIMKCGDCFIGNDSGITHLSAAVGIPTISLFGPTNPDVWGPRGEHVRILKDDVGCSPCDPERLRSCTRQRCLEGISVDMVYRTMKRIIENSKPGTRNSKLWKDDA
jgi:ADP-heptose:LPS heptosyltransferase